MHLKINISKKVNYKKFSCNVTDICFFRWLNRINMLTAGYAERERIKQEQGKGILFFLLLLCSFPLLFSSTVFDCYHLRENANVNLCCFVFFSLLCTSKESKP